MENESNKKEVVILGIGRWVFETLQNVIEPLVKEINMILDRVTDEGLEKAIEKVIKLERDRIIINSILYLSLTIIVCYTIWRIMCK